MRQLILAYISLFNVKGLYNYIEECVYKSMCVCVLHVFMAFEIEPQNILEAKK